MFFNVLYGTVSWCIVMLSVACNIHRFTDFTPNKIKNLFTNHFRFISDDKHLHIFPFLLENTELQTVRENRQTRDPANAVFIPQTRYKY